MADTDHRIAVRGSGDPRCVKPMTELDPWSSWSPRMGIIRLTIRPVGQVQDEWLVPVYLFSLLPLCGAGRTG
jgi:hypothetical protein